MLKIGGCRFCEALSGLYDAEKVVEYRDEVLHIGGHVPTEQQLNELANEAMLLRRTGIWALLTETVKAQAIDMGIRKSKDFDQLMFAKAMLHVVEVQESIINAIHVEHQKRKAVAIDKKT